jgi:hypothetical protein
MSKGGMVGGDRLEPPDQAAADPLGERGQIGLVDRAGGQERRRRPASML